MLPERLFILLFALAATVASLARPAFSSSPAAAVSTRPGDHARPVAAPPRQESAADVLTSIPRSVELVLVIDGIGSLADSPVADSLWRLIADFDDPNASDQAKKKPASVQESWSRLAGELGMTKREAIDRLVGTRLVLMMTDLESSDSRRWAVTSIISEATDRDLIARLRPSRRAIVEQHAIRAIEDGRYELTTHLHAGPGRWHGASPPDSKTARPSAPAAGDRAVSLLLAESGKAELFDEIVGAWAGRAVRTLGETDLPREAARLGQSQILLAVRVDPDDPMNRSPEQDWRNFILLTGRVTEHGLELRAMLRDRGFEQELTRVRPSSDAALAMLNADVALAVIESRLEQPALAPAGPSPRPNPVERLFAVLGLSHGVQERLVGRQLLVVSGHPAPSTLPLAASATDRPASRHRLSICLGAETDDLSTLAPLADACMSEHIAALEERAGALLTGVRQPINLAGVACGAVRRASVSIAPASPLGTFFRSPLDLAWTFVPTSDPTSPRPAGHAEPAPGWWITSIAGESRAGSSSPAEHAHDHPNIASSPTLPAGAPHKPLAPPRRDPSFEACVRAMQADRAAPDAGVRKGEIRRWFSLGVLRPAALIDLVLPILPLHDWERPMKRVEALEWRLYVTPSQDLEGSLTVTVRPDAPTPATKSPAALPVPPAARSPRNDAPKER